MTAGSIAIIDKGLRCLSENLGTEETEYFVSALLREGFNYTEWRKTLVDRIKTYEDVEKLVEADREKAQYTGNGVII